MKNKIRDRDESCFGRLRWRTALVVAAAYLIPFVLFYVVVEYLSVRHVRDQVYAYLATHVATSAHLLDDVLQVRVAEVKSLAQAFSWTGSPLAQSPAVLRGYFDGNPWYWLLLVADSSGEIVAASGEIRGNIREREYFRQALAKEAVISNLFVSSLTQKAEMVVAARLRGRDGQVFGVLVAALTLDNLKSRPPHPSACRAGGLSLVEAIKRSCGT